MFCAERGRFTDLWLWPFTPLEPLLRLAKSVGSPLFSKNVGSYLSSSKKFVKENWKGLSGGLGVLGAFGAVILVVIYVLDRFPLIGVIAVIPVGLAILTLPYFSMAMAWNVARDYQMWSRLQRGLDNSITVEALLNVVSNFRTDSMRIMALRVIRQDSLFPATSNSELVLTCLAIAIENDRNVSKQTTPGKGPANVLDSPVRIEIFEGCPEFLNWYKEYSRSHAGGLRYWSSATLDEITRLREQVRAVRVDSLH